MSVNGIGTDKYMGETYQERLGKITDPHAKSAFQAAYAKKMAGSTDYVSTISKTYNTGKADGCGPGLCKTDYGEAAGVERRL